MADYGFAQALTWESAQIVHERWLIDYNNQAHWAHRKRDDGKYTPLEVLGGAKATPYPPAHLRRVFRNRFERHANRWGYIRFRRWKLYTEVGVGGETVAVWLTRQTLTIEQENIPLAQYAVTYQPDDQHFVDVQPRHFFETKFTLPRLLSVAGMEWVAVQRVEASPRRVHRDPYPPLHQAQLFERGF